ncbi:MAG: hypothetical protein EXR07_00420 [Acetobacteraceae bacterium]|nr:hypothetical protein [Acetobacteraceae bacterium]
MPADPVALNSVEKVSLDTAAARDIGPVAERIALQDADLPQWMARRIVWTFIAGNLATLAALGALALLDQVNIGRHLIAPGDRIVSYQVVMALLGATTVPIGTIAAIIARYLFPGRTREG